LDLCSADHLKTTFLDDRQSFTNSRFVAKTFMHSEQNGNKSKTILKDIKKFFTFEKSKKKQHKKQ